MESNPAKVSYWYQHVENYLIDSRKFIKKSQYRKCIVSMDTQCQKLQNTVCPLILMLQLSRRLVYCMTRILRSYIVNQHEIDDKHHSYIFERIHHYLKLYHHHLEIVLRREDCNINYLLNFNGKKQSIDQAQTELNKKKIKFYVKDFFKLMANTASLQQEYFKREQAVAQGYIFFSKFNLRLFHRFEDIVLREFILHYVWEGSFNFNLQLLPQAESSYFRAIEFIQIQMEHIHKYEIDTVRDQQLKIQIEKITTIMIVLSYLYENQEAYERSVEALKVAIYFQRNFLIGQPYKELSEMINQRETKLKSQFKRMIEIDKDLRHIIRLALDIEPEIDANHVSENFWLDQHHTEMYDKFDFRSMNQKQMILKKEKKPPAFLKDSIKEVRTEQEIDRIEKNLIQMPLVKHSTTIGEIATSRSSMFMKHSGHNAVEKNATKDTFSTRFHSIATTHNPSHFFKSERSTLHEILPTSTVTQTDVATARSESQATQKLKKMQQYTKSDHLIQTTYMNLIEKAIPKEELESKKEYFEKRFQQVAETDKCFNADIGVAHKSTKFKKTCLVGKPKTYTSRTKFINGVKQREELILLKNKVESKNQPKQLEAEVQIATANKFKNLVLEHSKELGLDHLRSISNVASTQPDEVMEDDSKKFRKIVQQTENISKMIMRQYEQQFQLLDQPYKPEPLHCAKFVEANLNLAKSVEKSNLAIKRRRFLGSIKDIVALKNSFESRKIDVRQIFGN